MLEFAKKLEKDLMKSRERIREKRREITGGVVEDRIKEKGKSFLAASLDIIDNMEVHLEEAVAAIQVSTGSVRNNPAVKKLEGEIERLRSRIRESRREITGGVAEDKAKALLVQLEEELVQLIDKLKNLRE
jgi:hypothetical protein